MSLRPETRVALELAVTEEVEAANLSEAADAQHEDWRAEEEVGAIADDLLLPEGVTERLEQMKAEKAKGPPQE